MNEEWGGYVIEFTADEQEGYAIFFSINGTLKLIEINFNAFSPFYGKAGMKIYPALGYYYLKIDGSYYNASTMNLDNDYAKTQTPEFYATCGNKSNVSETRTIQYNYGYYYSYAIPNFYYHYTTDLTGQNNNCANAAGLILLNYWNKKFNNDLLKLPNDQLDAQNNISESKGTEIMRIFYEYMGTNWFFGNGGTLPSDCYFGFEEYVIEHGYNATTRVGILYDEIISYIKNGLPVLITSTDYYFTDSPYHTENPNGSLSALPSPTPRPMPGSSSLTINYKRWSGIINAHMFVAYGYAYYSLFDSNNQNFKEQLLRVADGWNGTRYFNYTASSLFDTAVITVSKPQ